MRKTIKAMLIIFAKVFGGFFYDRKYLKGRYFNNSSKGWRWVLQNVFLQKIIGINRSVPWPVFHTILINNWRNIVFNPDDLHIFQTGGTYFQAQDAKIIIGQGTWIAPNVGLITTNHNVKNLNEHVKGKDIVLGEKCWIGMNAIVLPGVVLGPHTIVAAGAIVTKSYREGYCVLAGNPAKPIKTIDAESIICMEEIV